MRIEYKIFLLLIILILSFLFGKWINSKIERYNIQRITPTDNYKFCSENQREECYNLGKDNLCLMVIFGVNNNSMCECNLADCYKNNTE